MNQQNNDPSPEPLYKLIRSIRHPASLRELIATCLRTVHGGDPFSDKAAVPSLPEELIDGVETREEIVSGSRCVIYSPRGNATDLPLLFYMHGGGFVVGCSEDTDYITRRLCYANRMNVVSVNYRLAPETIFPSQINDCCQVVDTLIEHSSRLKLDTNSIYLGGDSAGANLAIALFGCLKNHQRKIRGLILLAPWLDMHVENYESFNRLAPTDLVLDSAFLSYARAAYVCFEQWKEPLASPLLSNIGDLPQTIVLIGSEDPLVDQSLRLQEKAQSLGCEHIQVEIFNGMPHSFYQFPTLFHEEVACFERIFKFLQKTTSRK